MSERRSGGEGWDFRQGDESEELEELDDLFDALDEGRAQSSRAQTGPSSLAADRNWIADFSSAREIMVRPAFESILWRLEERGFDADVIALPSDELGDDAEALVGVSLQFTGTDASGASVRGTATVEPVIAHGTVRVRTLLDEPPYSVLDTEIPLESLTEEYVLSIAADLLARAFFGDDAPPRRVVEDDPRWIATDDGIRADDEGDDEGPGTFDPEEALERPGALRRSTTAKLPFFEFDQKEWEEDLEELTDELPSPGD